MTEDKIFVFNIHELVRLVYGDYNMTERFELKVNHNNQCDIIDWVESKEKDAICIYNDLGCYYFSSAKALCKLLNDLNDDNGYLKKSVNEQQVEIDYLAHLNGEFKEENEKLKQELQQLKDLILHLGYTIKNENGTISLELKESIIFP